MLRAALLTLLLAAGVACSSGRPATSSAGTVKMASADTAKPAGPPAAPAAPACDYKIVAMSDPAQKQIQCPNGESFVVRRGEDGKWHEEMRVRAGIRPAYDTPEDAARARCCPPASE
jgi:hypothetical protein